VYKRKSAVDPAILAPFSRRGGILRPFAFISVERKETFMSSATETKPRERAPLNGVNTPVLFATIDVVRNQPELAKFQFRATNRWVTGTHSRSRIEFFSGAGAEHKHSGQVEFDADHPGVLVGADNAPTPVEFLLHAIASCITSGIGNIAAARGVKLTEVTSTVEGDIDLRGILGLDPSVRNGYQQMRVHFTIKGDATAEKLREIVEQAKARSAVYDVLTNGIPLDITIDSRRG
jgi:uncharacterized OsmC-like protein